MRKLFWIVSFAVIFSCQEEVQERGIPNPNPPPGNNPPENPVSGKYSSCLSVLSDVTLDVATWNIEQFPKSPSTIAMMTDIIKTMNADIIAVQEINSLNSFNQLVASLDGWSGRLYLNGSLGQGFLYKNSEITSLSELTLLFAGDTYAFPRPLVVTTAKHISGKEITLVNVHLKCCDDGELRRKDASVKLKSYLDNNMASKAVVVLGDYNDEIAESASTNVFQNFINDANNYRFADMDLAKAGPAYWSYPSWPSHIDHILVTNELFADIYSVKTLSLGNCEGSYSDVVSDHLPVMIRLD